MIRFEKEARGRRLFHQLHGVQIARESHNKKATITCNNNLEVMNGYNAWFEETPLRGRGQHLSDYGSLNHRDGRL